MLGGSGGSKGPSSRYSSDIDNVCLAPLILLGCVPS